jgi:putative ABC transport system permease protein
MTTDQAPSHTHLGAFLAGFAVLWLKWRSSLVLALRSLWLHKLRSFLSVLGIIIGTGAVIVLMAFGKGSMEDALEEIRQQGTTNLIVRSVKPVDDTSAQRRSWVASYGLTWDDYDRFKTIGTVVQDVPMRIFPQEVRYLDRKINARVVATTATYAHINRFTMAVGRFLVDGKDQNDEGDDQRFRNVVVLGSRVAETLFPFEQPVGQSVVINKLQYEVIGVIKDRTPRTSGGGGGSQSQEDFNSDVYMPIQTAKVRFGRRMIIRQGGGRSAEEVALHQIILTVADIDQVRSTGEVVKDLLQRYHTKNDWEVAVPLDRLVAAEHERDRFIVLLFIIGGISLLVGGIGIMNIMLATVTERTREIGIRRALGAKRKDIIMQFLIEAVVQTSLGGMLGMLTGLAIIFGVPPLWQLVFGKHLPAMLSGWSIVISLTFAVIVGVGFGLYPAWRASRLDPIEALRHE